uniref:Adipocyte plasma membrane-associated protein n=1 Tax=Timema poppense TaxID=170557 RepID=A0A7R9D4P3_TIMPO|nr:unnamed protein product [Timema poppensis]
MGKITTLVFASVIVFLVVTYLPGLPPYMEFTAQSITPPMELKGVLALNERLNNAEHLFKGEVKGAESFAVHKGSLYSGLHGGYIVKIVANKVIPVTKFGSSQCLGFWDEAKCGRPLGLKSGKDGYLYVADAYYGLYKVNTTTGASTLLVSKNVAINGKEPRLPNSVDVAKDGTMYWTDSSTDILLQDGVYALLGDGSGSSQLSHLIIHLDNAAVLIQLCLMNVIAESLASYIFWSDMFISSWSLILTTMVMNST